MDPNAARDRIIEAMNDADPDELREAANDLAEWLERGGFAPTPVTAFKKHWGYGA